MQRYVIILLLVILSLVSCSDSETESECSIADSVAIIDQLSNDGKTYYLVHRISGWHDKIESFELYGTQPTFDNCGNSVIVPLFGASIDDRDSDNNDQYVAHIYLEPSDRFFLDYAPGAPPTPDHYKNLTLERRNIQ